MALDDLNRGIALMILHAAAFNIQTDDKALKALFQSAVGHLPGDLFVSSVRRVLALWKDTFRLPSPAHILDEAKTELQRRRARAKESRDTPFLAIKAPKSRPDEIRAARAEIAGMPAGPLRRALESLVNTYRSEDA